ncbi:tandem-95 repeat protein [Patescibacteria group bacterium]
MKKGNATPKSPFSKLKKWHPHIKASVVFLGVIVASALYMTTFSAPSGEAIDICHVTGSSSNPYTYLSVSPTAIDGLGGNDHSQHHGDIIPALDLDEDGDIDDDDCNLYGTNEIPVANDDSAVTDLNVAVDIDVTANDTDADGTIDTTTVQITDLPGDGTVSVDPVTGVVTYTPDTDFSGIDTFQYSVRDNLGAVSNQATVTVYIDINDPPVANDDSASTDEDTSVLIDVPANDTDSDGTLDLTTVVVTGGPSNGSTSVNPTTGVVTYTPNAGYNGLDSFTYTIDDNDADTSNEATVTITISDVNDPPTANDDSATTDEDTPVGINVPSNDSDSDGTLDLTTVAIVAHPSDGSVSVNPTTGEVTYTPDLNFNGSDSFTYTIDDDDGATSNIATVTVTVNDVNDPPVANDDFATVDEDDSVVIDVPANDDDIDGTLDLSSVTVTGGPTNGSTSVNPSTGGVTYTPDAEYCGSDEFTYTIDDNDSATSNEATVYVTVTCVNDDPVANDDSATTDEDTPVLINVPSNDTDSDGTLNLTSVIIVDLPSNGSVSVNPTTGVATYTPDLNYNGSDSFTYTIDDNDGGTSNVATVTITINDVNDPPVANNDTATTNEDTAVGIVVKANDTDVDGILDPTTVTIVDYPTDGGVSVNPTTGVVTYTPDADYNGSDSFTYTIDDNDGATSNVATVTITINDVNDPPVANDDTASTNEDVAVDIDVPANDTDIDGTVDLTTVTIVDHPTDGGVSVNPTTGVVTYTPDLNYNGSDSFTYTIDDDDGATSNTATVTINIGAVVDPPTANDDSATTNEDTPVDIDVPANDTDPDGTIDDATVAIVDLPSDGGVSVNPTTGVVTYTPDLNYNGSDSFTYTVNDNDGNISNVATVTITINDVNDPPVANNDSDSTDEDTPVIVDVPANDTDVDGTVDLTTVAIVDDPAHGSVSVNPTTGAVTYTPDLNYNGSDIFTYTIDDDDSATSNTATVTITINDVNDPPIANDDSETTDEDTPVGIDVPANDTDIDGTVDPTTVAIATPPSNGGVSVNPTTGEITYTPDLNYNGGDSFTYTIDDDDGATSNAATVTITINDVNDPPIANNDSGTTDEDDPVIINVPSNDTDIDGFVDLTTVAIVDDPTHGTVEVNPATGAVTYTPDADYNGSDLFTYTIDDDDGATSNTATVNITINDVNDPPIANDDTASTDEDVPVGIDVKVNDTDIDGTVDQTTVQIIDDPAHGLVSVNPGNGVVTYTPDENYNGSDSFTYTIQDDDGATSNTATVTINIGPVVDPPTANDDSETTNEDTPVDINVPANDTDPDGTIDPTTVSIETPPSDGLVSVNPTTGVVTYTPDADFFGSDSFTYKIRDDEGNISNEATVDITINDVNDPPIANDDSETTDEDVPVDVDVTANDTDVDGTVDPTTVVIVDDPAHGSLYVDPTTGVVTYTPDANYNGSDLFTYKVNDDDSATSNTATVTLTVDPINDPPVAVNDNATTDEDTPVPINVPGNDTDIDGTLNLTTVTIVIPPANGVPGINASTGVITYSPNADYHGGDSFTYTIEDDDAAVSNEATVFITINDVNDPPIANDDSETTDEDVPVDIDVTANDTDVDGTIDPTTVVILDDVDNGSTSVHPATGVVTYTPDSDYNGSDSFTYEVDDDDSATSNTATVSIRVNDVNDPPVANNDSATTPAGQDVTIDVPNNDEDPDGTIDPTTVTIVDEPPNGTVSVDPQTGEVTYTPDSGFVGNDSFTYTIEDNDGAVSGLATVSVEVQGGSRPPGGSSCGNNKVEANEECDDGNRQDGDGCNKHCKLEPPPGGPTPVHPGPPQETCLEFNPLREVLYTDNEEIWTKDYVDFLSRIYLTDKDQFIISGSGSFYGSSDATNDTTIRPLQLTNRFETVKIALTSACIPIYTNELRLEAGELLTARPDFPELPRRVTGAHPDYKRIDKETLNFITNVFYTAYDKGIIDGRLVLDKSLMVDSSNDGEWQAQWEDQITRAEILKVFVNAFDYDPRNRIMYTPEELVGFAEFHGEEDDENLTPEQILEAAIAKWGSYYYDADPNEWYAQYIPMVVKNKIVADVCIPEELALANGFDDYAPTEEMAIRTMAAGYSCTELDAEMCLPREVVEASDFDDSEMNVRELAAEYDCENLTDLVRFNFPPARFTFADNPAVRGEVFALDARMIWLVAASDFVNRHSNTIMRNDALIEQLRIDLQDNERGEFIFAIERLVSLLKEKDAAAAAAEVGSSYSTQ